MSLEAGNAALAVSVISLLLSGALGILRVYEFLSERKHGLSATIMSRAGPDRSDCDLLLLNGGQRPSSVYYLSLDWTKPSPLGKWCPIGRKVLRNERSPEDSFVDLKIPAGGQHMLFEGEAFGQRPENSQLCLKLWIVGRKSPVVIWPN